MGTGVFDLRATSSTVSRSMSVVTPCPSGGSWMALTMRGTKSWSGLESAKPPFRRFGQPLGIDAGVHREPRRLGQHRHGAE